ncbi:hypothetical protein Dsin_006864 [Dipteronia sinensis]|uniref:DNA-directed RNA polymerase n=1 Tax=Dipteronia sinensis TaxID=43782 RepID=A0AAE0EGK4_9ROSI|nr:hypothetical protein Dsin_006864 [Dipteronia sinensis]
MEENRKYEVSLIKQYLRERGLVREQVNSFNNFVNTGLRDVVWANDVVVSKVDPEIYVRFLDVKIDRPCVLMNGVYEDINPKMCRASEMTYQAPIMANIKHVAVKNSEKRVLLKKNFVIGYMPIMLQSCACVLDGKDEAGMIELGECPLDPGGYFIIEGIERIPIMVVLKAMGMTDNEKIEKMIAGEFSPETSEEKESEGKKKSDDSLRELLADSILECFEIRDQNQALDYLQRKVKLDIQSRVQVRNNDFHPKCVYVGLILKRMMEVKLKRIPVDDKDSMGNKVFELSGRLVLWQFEVWYCYNLFCIICDFFCHFLSSWTLYL